MAKTVEISFAIGASLSGNFNNVFGKAGQAIIQLQQRSAELQKTSGQIAEFQKMQDAVAKNQAAMSTAREQAKGLEVQIAASSTRTAELKSQYRESQSNIENFNTALVRNRDAYKQAQLNVLSLENQIKNSTAPTDELQKKYATAQAEARRLGEAVKQNSVSLKAEQATAKRLNSEIKKSALETRTMSKEAQGLKDKADKLQTGLDKGREALVKLQAELKNAGLDTNNLAKEQERLISQSDRAAEAQTRLQNAQARYSATKDRLSWNNIKGELISGAAMGYALYKPVSQAADFESAMARVNAVAFTGLGKSKEQQIIDSEQFKQLQEQARQLGRETQYTAVQAANTQEVLARAGFRSNEILSAMPGLLSMAAAEGMDLANAADIAASSLRGFKLPADQMNRVADVLAQTSAASNTSIAGLGESMKMVAPVAANLGVSIEQTAAMLGVMANNGIKGTESGTALRNAFLRLSQEPKEVEKALKKMGIASRTANGNMRELPDIMQALSDKMKKMGEADQLKYLANIFGVRAASGMLAVMEGVTNGSMRALEQQNKEATGIFNALTEAVNKDNKEALVTVEDFRTAMANAEAPAKKLGISYRDLSIYTAILAKNNIKGAEADKKLTAAFTQLIKKPSELQKALKKYNISALEKNGTMRDFPDFLRDLNNAMSKMDEPEQLKALTKIFGSDDAAKAIQNLMRDIPNSFSEYDKAVSGAKGVSYEMMQKQLATFKGQWNIAKSAMSDFMIEVGNNLLPEATKVVKLIGKVAAGITELMQKYPEWSSIVVKGLGAIAALKITKKVYDISKAILELPSAWLEVSKATKGVIDVAGTLPGVIGNSAGSVSNLKSLIMALTGPLGIVAAAVALIALNWEDVCAWCEKAGEAIKSIDHTTPTAELKPNTPDYHIRMLESAFAPSGTYAEGGIVSSPTLSLIGEAGREAVIPLENKSRGIPLLKQAAQELGISAQNNYAEIKPHALGGIFSTPHIGLVAEAGREAVIPLENKSRGLPLLNKAAQELGVGDKLREYKDSAKNVINNFIPKLSMPTIPNLSSILDLAFPPKEKNGDISLWEVAESNRDILAPQNTTNTTTNNANLPAFSPVVNITVNGGDPSIAEQLKQMVLSLMQDKFEEFIDVYWSNMQRVVFV